MSLTVDRAQRSVDRLEPAAPAGAQPASGRSGRVALVLRALPGLALLLLAAQPLRRLVEPITDPDTWWHLRVGDDVWRTWDLASPAPWTPFEKHPTWDLTQWLPELVASWSARNWGLPGVAWLYAAGTMLVLAAVLFATRRQADRLPASVVTAVAFVAMMPTLTPRPQLVTFVLLAVTTAAWLRTVDDLRPRWWLVPLTWVWACSHGMWFSGLALGFAVTAGIALDRRAGWRQVLRLAAVPTLGLAAAALTPVGPRLLLTPFAVGEITGYITEWAPPSFRDISPALTIVMIGIVAAAWMRGRRRPPWALIAVLALATGWTLLSVRTVTLGCIMAAPLLACVLQTWLRRPARAPSRSEALSCAAGLAACLVLAGLVATHAPTEPGATPNAFDATLDRLPAGTVVFDEYRLGGWLQWRHPQLYPVIDGRTEAYPPEHVRSVVEASAAMPGWRDLIARTKATWAVVETSSPLASALPVELGWTVVGTDHGYVLLRKATQR